MTMISEYNAMQAPEANEHDAHAALADACRVITREVGLGRMPLARDFSACNTALDAYDRELRAERQRRALFD
jgi:hypothetical protein